MKTSFSDTFRVLFDGIENENNEKETVVTVQVIYENERWLPSNDACYPYHKKFTRDLASCELCVYRIDAAAKFQYYQASLCQRKLYFYVFPKIRSTEL